MNKLCPSSFIYQLRTVTEAAALATHDWIGRGEKEKGDGAAVSGMRAALNQLPIKGTVVIGEGEKDEAPMLFNGEVVGLAEDGMPEYDIAVDPIEGTSYMAKGLTNAMAVIALAPRGAMYEPGPAFYMEKFAACPVARGKVDFDAPVKEKLKQLSAAINKPMEDLTVFVLEKPRHKQLVREIHDAGARVALYPAGDVAGALMASIPNSGIDALMGTGGTPEGVLSAAAIRALGGEFAGRLAPQLQGEIAAVEAAGMDTVNWIPRDELVTSDEVYFCGTGITSGLLFDGVECGNGKDKTQTLMISGVSGEHQLLTTYHPH